MKNYSLKKNALIMPKSKKQCQEIRDTMRATILQKSLLYFARNGFSGTKISDLARNIGIGQGTIYVYFESKEDLYKEIFAIANYEEELKKLELLTKIPIPAKEKMKQLSKIIIRKLKEDEIFSSDVIFINSSSI